MISLQNAILFVAILLSGLIAGLLYAYSCSINPGLKALSDKEYVHAMQSINEAIQNPIFFLSFVGLLAVYPLSVYRVYTSPLNLSTYLMIIATLIYFFGVFGLTMWRNVPLNELLAKFDISQGSSGQITAMRQRFEGPWNNYHAVRTFASILSFGLTILSVMKQKI